MHLEEFYGSVDQPARVGPPRGRSTATPAAALLAAVATGSIQCEKD